MKKVAAVRPSLESSVLRGGAGKPCIIAARKTSPGPAGRALAHGGQAAPLFTSATSFSSEDRASPNSMAVLSL